jgi:DNA-binding transcriptional ArsR family regulator
MTTRSKDELFQILSNSRRRYIIYYLAEVGGEMSLKQLATKIAAAESDTTESEVAPEERQRVYISLYQTHLPKLEETGVAVYDEDERTVTLTPETLEEGFFWMDTGRDGPAGRARYSLALAVASWALVVGVWLSLPVVGSVGWAGVALAAAVALSVVAVLQYRAERAEGADGPGYEILVE